MLDSLSHTVGISSALGVLDGDKVVYLARSASFEILSPIFNSGRCMPIYCSAIGLMLLALKSQEEREFYIGHTKLLAYTNNTVTQTDELRKILDDARANGYVYSSSWIGAEYSSLAVPVVDTSGTYVAGMSVIVPNRKIQAKSIVTRYLPALSRAAKELGGMLFPA
ncbi:MAG: IclR family transcriptional regulator C-terminal domain-containing protein [Terracidiphilus sp.]|nr:IclR family transcriptional regulator C-terminal domain-containing protein [Terracidiphilus sp.]